MVGDTLGHRPPVWVRYSGGEDILLHRHRSPLHATAGGGGQTTVGNCIGGHVNVLSDYKKT